MPCYTVSQCSVSLERADIDLLFKALVAEGYTVYRSTGSKAITFRKGETTGSYRNNRLEFSYSSKKPDTDAIKRSYSKEVILAKAEAYAEDGWELTQDGDTWVLENHRGYGATVNA